MVSCYEHLGIEDLRKDTERVLEENDPNSRFNDIDLMTKKRDWWRFWDSLLR